jgi:hypothetical protein
MVVLSVRDGYYFCERVTECVGGWIYVLVSWVCICVYEWVIEWVCVSLVDWVVVCEFVCVRDCELAPSKRERIGFMTLWRHKHACVRLPMFVRQETKYTQQDVQWWKMGKSKDRQIDRLMQKYRQWDRHTYRLRDRHRLKIHNVMSQ